MRVVPSALARCDPRRPIQALAGEALGTRWQVRCHAAGAIDTGQLRVAIEARLAAIVAEMSQWEPNSLLSRFNRAPAGYWTPLPEDFATVLSAAIGVAEASDGAFDPTYGRTAALLGHGAETIAAMPSAGDLDSAWSAAGWRRLRFDPATRGLRQPGGLWLDFAGIGKGFAVDAVADLVRSHGIADALVEIGGELVGRGLRPDGQPWWVDLETPPGAGLARTRIGLHENAVATSGDYVCGAHTIDPRTGRPLGSGVTAVSVVHDNAMLADAWATALLVLGCEEGLELANRLGLAARILIRGEKGLSEAVSRALLAMMDEDDRP